MSDYAALTETNSTYVFSGTLELNENLVLEWPNDSVQSITISADETFDIVGDGALHIKYPESDPNGESHDIILSGSAIWSYVIVG